MACKERFPQKNSILVSAQVPSAAVLILLPAAAGAGVVAAHLLGHLHGLLGRAVSALGPGLEPLVDAGSLALSCGGGRAAFRGLIGGCYPDCGLALGGFFDADLVEIEKLL